MSEDLYQIPEGIPAPTDDGAADHLPGASIPSLPLASTAGDGLTFVSENGKITKVFYPVFPPGENAARVVEWLEGRFRARF